MAKTVPDSMAHYATYELSQILLTLTPAQREAVGRIVDHVYINNRPLGHLLDGDDKICAEKTYYRRGTFDEESGEWLNPGCPLGAPVPGSRGSAPPAQSQAAGYREGRGRGEHVGRCYES